MEILNEHFPGMRKTIEDCGVGILSLRSIPGFRSILVEIVAVGNSECICSTGNHAIPKELNHISFPVRLRIMHSDKKELMSLAGKGNIIMKKGKSYIKIRIEQVLTFFKNSKKIKVYS
jgi:hypothetical protein